MTDAKTPDEDFNSNKITLLQAVNDLESAIDLERRQLQELVYEKSQAINRLEKILDLLKRELSSFEGTVGASDQKVAHIAGAMRSRRESQSDAIRRLALSILEVSNGSLSKSELVERLLESGIRSNDPIQLIRRALTRDKRFASSDTEYYLFR